MRIQITYPGIPNVKLDDRIWKAMESIGAKWYAQGYDVTKGIRDICFDWKDNEPKV